MYLNQTFNHYLNKLTHPQTRLVPKRWSPFHFFGGLGVTWGTILMLFLAWRLNLSLLVIGGLVPVAVLILLGLTMLTKIIAGAERIINYHHQIAVIVVTAGLLWLLGRPILPYLDLIMLGMGLFIALGRMACVQVGCCHGRPHRWGVCYGPAHVEEGFPPYLAGVRLFPVPAVESLWVLGIVVGGTIFVLWGSPPGAVLAWHLVAYGLGRFCFEFWRGDPQRPYWWGFSEAQWIALLSVWVVVGLELAGVLPRQGWHTGAAVGLTLAVISIAGWRRVQPTPRHRLLHARHIKEVAEAIDNLSLSLANPANTIQMATTSSGVQLSVGQLEQGGKFFRHYTLSGQDDMLAGTSAKTLAGLIIQLRHPDSSGEIIEGRQQGVFHLVLQEAENRRLETPRRQ